MGAMTYARGFTIAAVAFVCIAAAPLVTFISPCECHDNHGAHRWAAVASSDWLGLFDRSNRIGVIVVPISKSWIKHGQRKEK